MASIGPGQNVLKLLLLGIVFHVVFIASVFDCYFTSPVVHGMNHHGSQSRGEAKRLVLIVADGLRADLLFTPNGFAFGESSPTVVAPHLRSIAEKRGAFGVSHTRVPTESRPGHVAIIGGMYEDVSAVTKGWKTNPVDFDSVFNQSSHTFSFGSPDILPMFSKGASLDKVLTWCYDEEAEDFTKDATTLDTWVLDQLRILFQNASTDATLNSQLRGDKVIFFLHLAWEYMQNIQVVENLVSQFYEDQETSYVFTADHGMSKIGNHGDGDPDSTRTPLIAWGKGIRGPLSDSTPTSHDEYSKPWNLGHLLRRDVSQADLAPLMATLIGIDWPSNSVGVLPDIDPTRAGYLAPLEGEEALARYSLVNVQVLLEHYLVKHEMKAAHAIFYKPFGLLEDEELGVPARIRKVAAIERLIEEGKWYDARRYSMELSETCLQGLRYLETYDRLLIRAIVVVAYLGWAAYASISLLPPAASLSASRSGVVNVVTIATLLGFWAAFWIQNSPWTFYVYVAFPCYFWRESCSRGVPALCKCVSECSPTYRNLCVQLILVISALQSMVVAYTHRSIWSAGYVVIGVLWPLFTWPSSLLSQNWKLVGLWCGSCIVTGVFPLLAVDKEESLPSILAGGGVMLLIGAIHLYSSGQNVVDKSVKISRAIQMGLVAAMMLVTSGSVCSLQARAGLPRLNQIAAWLILASSSVYPFISKVRHPSQTSKIISFFLSFAACFVILSISVEGLFYSAYTCNLLLWIEIEALVRNSDSSNGNGSAADQQLSISYRFRADDIRIALFFLFYVQVAFFGTGKSFYLEPVYRLVPIFNPFLMAALLIFKIVCPYVILSVAFATLNARLHLPPFSLFLVALTLTDGMTMTFFLNVTDTGSWLEIGQSISFFCITSLLLVWSAGICAAGEYLMGNTLVDRKSTKVN
ncbi:Phosphatidylinositolglycan class N-domain-containing protein [Pisolithus orientalis]|uniref:Phosphatidylinositolglycan class N-domain-containing protein n=1 Tax=Pisolithus orientalis TaxID=936130 RepID=UPI00222487DA|nr:Phosphatidylinositolglycan class N-domain-containing protein [Pisolithus orientalis]KAI6002424.1 Phosphatidylinositolglycan class N-domain-containing protein [Pisolithus orientalis]